MAIIESQQDVELPLDLRDKCDFTTDEASREIPSLPAPARRKRLGKDEDASGPNDPPKKARITKKGN